MQITFPQIQRVAELTTNPGYLLLIDALQAYIDDLTNALMEDEKLLSKWRAAKDLFEILKTYPEQLAIEAMSAEVGKVNEIVTRVGDVPQTPIPTDKLLRVKKMYEERLKVLNKE